MDLEKLEADSAVSADHHNRILAETKSKCRGTAWIHCRHEHGLGPLPERSGGFDETAMTQPEPQSLCHAGVPRIGTTASAWIGGADQDEFRARALRAKPGRPEADAGHHSACPVGALSIRTERANAGRPDAGHGPAAVGILFAERQVARHIGRQQQTEPNITVGIAEPLWETSGGGTPRSQSSAWKDQVRDTGRSSSRCPARTAARTGCARNAVGIPPRISSRSIARPRPERSVRGMASGQMEFPAAGKSAA